MADSGDGQEFHDEQEFLSPHKFIEDFCSRRSLVSAEDVGGTEVEKLCILRAEEAKKEYKILRDAKVSETDGPMSDADSEGSTQGNAGEHTEASAEREVVLSAQDKYQRRLRNNRKSAAATKVYNEVLKRELSTMLRRSEFVQPRHCTRLNEQFQKMKEQSNRLELENKELCDRVQMRKEKNREIELELRRINDSKIQTSNHIRALKSLAAGMRKDH